MFCLWEIHQRRGDNSPVQFRASRRLRQQTNYKAPSRQSAESNKRSNASNDKSANCNLNFYQSLKEIFDCFGLIEMENNQEIFNLNKLIADRLDNKNCNRMKDIIYSKLQKQRESIARFKSVIESTPVNQSLNNQITNI